MKTFYLSTFITLLFCFSLSAQTVTGTLSDIRILKINDTFVISGQDKDDNFKAILYDKNLKILKEYTLPYDKEAKRCSGLKPDKSSLVCVFSSGIIKAHGKILRLTNGLEEISIEHFTYEDIKKNQNKYMSLSASPCDENSNNEYIHFKNNKGLISKNLMYINTKNNVTLNNSAAQLKMPDSEEIFEAHTVVYYSLQKRYIAGGNYFDALNMNDLEKIRMKGMALLILNEDGEIIKSKKIDFPVYSFKEPGSFDFKDRVEYVDNIIVLASGNIVLNCTNAARYYPVTHAPNGMPYATMSPCPAGYTLGPRFCTVGFSYYEFSSELDEITSQFYHFPDTKDYMYARYMAATQDGKQIVFGNARARQAVATCEMTSEVITFSKNSSPTQKVNYTYKAEFDQHENVQPFKYHFLMDDSTLIIFRPQKRSYEFSIVKL